MTWLYRLADAARDRGRRKFWPPDLASGRRAEDLAHRFLRRRGLVIVARNYRPPSGAGEIDLIGWDGDRLAFIEVKSRASDEFGPPEQAVDSEKRRFLERAARTLVLAYSTGQPLKILPDEIAERTARAWDDYRGASFAHFRDLQQLLDERDSSYRN